MRARRGDSPRTATGRRRSHQGGQGFSPRSALMSSADGPVGPGGRSHPDASGRGRLHGERGRGPGRDVWGRGCRGGPRSRVIRGGEGWPQARSARERSHSCSPWRCSRRPATRPRRPSRRARAPRRRRRRPRARRAPPARRPPRRPRPPRPPPRPRRPSRRSRPLHRPPRPRPRRPRPPTQPPGCRRARRRTPPPGRSTPRPTTTTTARGRRSSTRSPPSTSPPGALRGSR